MHLLGVMTDAADNNSRDKISSNGMKIEVGIERVQNLLTKEVLFLYTGQNDYDLYNAIKEIGMYVRKDNGIPIDKYNHYLDTLRYAGNYFTKTYLV